MHLTYKPVRACKLFIFKLLPALANKIAMDGRTNGRTEAMDLVV